MNNLRVKQLLKIIFNQSHICKFKNVYVEIFLMK